MKVGRIGLCRSQNGQCTGQRTPIRRVSFRTEAYESPRATCAARLDATFADAPPSVLSLLHPRLREPDVLTEYQAVTAALQLQWEVYLDSCPGSCSQHVQARNDDDHESSDGEAGAPYTAPLDPDAHNHPQLPRHLELGDMDDYKSSIKMFLMMKEKWSVLKRAMFSTSPRGA